MSKLFIFWLTCFLLVVSIVSPLLLTSYSFSPTGFAVEQTAIVTLGVQEQLVIVLTNDTLNFGSCAINQTQGFSFFDSSLNNSQVDNSLCVGGSFPNSFALRNIGNVVANVSVEFGTTGQDFFNNTDSWIAFGLMADGCEGYFPSTFTQVDQLEFIVCDQLPIGVAQDLLVHLQVFVNASSRGGGVLPIQFIASPAD